LNIPYCQTDVVQRTNTGDFVTSLLGCLILRLPIRRAKKNLPARTMHPYSPKSALLQVLAIALTIAQRGVVVGIAAPGPPSDATCASLGMWCGPSQFQLRCCGELVCFIEGPRIINLGSCGYRELSRGRLVLPMPA